MSSWFSRWISVRVCALGSVDSRSSRAAITGGLILAGAIYLSRELAMRPSAVPVPAGNAAAAWHGRLGGAETAAPGLLPLRKEAGEEGGSQLLDTIAVRAARGRDRERIETRGARDFSGERFGAVVVADGGIRLGGRAGEQHRTELRAGSYFSPVEDRALTPREQMDATFDRIAFVCDADVPSGSALTLEFRTIAYADDGEGWSAWREIDLREPGRMVALGELAQQWQYRLTLTAPDAARSFVVRSVTAITRQDPKLAATAFPFADRLEDAR